MCCTGLLSKVSQAVQALDISSSPAAAPQQGSEEPAASPNSVLQSQSSRHIGSASQTAARTTQGSRSEQLQQLSNSDSAAADEDDWQRASSSHNAARKKKRKQQRRSAMQAVAETAEAEPASGAVAVTKPAPITASDALIVNARTGTDAQTVSTATETSHMTSHDAAAAVDPPTDANSRFSVDDSPAEHTAASSSSAPSSQYDEEEQVDEGSAASGSQGSASISGSEQAYSDDESESEAEDGTAGQSSVASVTADFAMQNVILQMGLRLVAPNGMRIKQLSRWVLRCSACFKITKVRTAARVSAALCF